MKAETETSINLYQDQRTLFTSDTPTINKLKRLGVPTRKENESGTWFDLENVVLSIQVAKVRGTGYKSEEI